MGKRITVFDHHYAFTLTPATMDSGVSSGSPESPQVSEIKEPLETFEEIEGPTAYTSRDNTAGSGWYLLRPRRQIDYSIARPK